jgi:hypothetical protein
MFSEACSSNTHNIICNYELDDIVTSFSETLKNAAIGANKGRNIRSSKFKKRHKDKPWHDIDCKSKLGHIKNLGRLLSNSPWDKS